jgi:hypothetical protein
VEVAMVAFSEFEGGFGLSLFSLDLI